MMHTSEVRRGGSEEGERFDVDISESNNIIRPYFPIYAMHDVEQWIPEGVIDAAVDREDYDSAHFGGALNRAIGAAADGLDPNSEEAHNARMDARQRVYDAKILSLKRQLS